MSEFDFLSEPSGTTEGYNKELKKLFRSFQESDINLSSTIREHLQNSADAKRKGVPLVFKVSKKKVDLSFFPFDKLKESLEHCITFQRNTFENEDSFEKDISHHIYKKGINAIKSINPSSVSVFVIEDNGVGLGGDTRFIKYNTERNALDNILSRNITTKGNDSLGAFGVGKLTAYLLTDIFTIFYLSRHKGNSKFIGTTTLQTYITPNDIQEGPQLLFGKPVENNQIKRIDWLDADKHINLKNIRTIQDDGLTTIIPNTSGKYDDWLNEALYICIYSYFKKIEEGDIVIKLYDEQSNKEIEINKNNFVRLYNEIEDCDFVNHDELSKYNYQLIKTFISKNNEFNKCEFEKKLRVNKKYQGKLIVEAFQNEELLNLSKSLDPKYRFGFRYIRDGMLVRAEHLPKRRFPGFDSSICGLLYFEKGDPLNVILYESETQSHDEHSDDRLIARSELENDFPKIATINQNFRSGITGFLKVVYKKMSDYDEQNKESYDYVIDELVGNLDNEKNQTDSYFRKLVLGKEESKRKNNPKQNTTPSDGEGSTGQANVDQDENGDDGTIDTHTWVIGPDDKNNNDDRGRKEQEEEKTKPGTDNTGETSIANMTFNSKTVFTGNQGENHTYKILFDQINFSDNYDFEIHQDSLLRKSILSFELIKIYQIVNGKKVKLDFEEKRNSKAFPTHYLIKNVKNISNENSFELIVNEYDNTLSQFKFQVK